MASRSLECSEARPERRPPSAAGDPRRSPPSLPPPGQPERWSELQRLRRGQLPLQPWIEALDSGALNPDADLLAALWGRLERPSVERLLRSGGLDPQALLAALGGELPWLVSEPRVRQAWLEPLLAHLGSDPEAVPTAWLELIGHFRDARVAGLLRAAIGSPRRPPDALVALLPLLGCQRLASDGALLLNLARDPGPRQRRHAALEALAVGLSSWPPTPLAAGLQQLASDLDEALAAAAVDLLARLPAGQQALRQLQRRPLAPPVAARLQRRLRRSPLVLVVHGRQGGLIPEVLQELARDLGQRRGAPVLLQALTAAAPPLAPRLRLAAERAGRLTLVPLLLLPGEHVRRDLPALAADWRQRLAVAAGSGTPLAEPAPVVRRLAFLGAWPAWQQLLAEQLAISAQGRPLTWLHHPLQGPLGERYLCHLGQTLGHPGVAVAYQAEPAVLRALAGAAPVLAPLTLAPNRLSESLNMEASAPAVAVLPPLLDWPAVRDFLLCQLETLP